MANGYKIIWSKEALRRLSRIYEYLQEKWTDREIHKLSLQLNRSILTILNQPLAFPTSSFSSETHRCVVGKHQTIFYTIKENEIVIITIHDNRMKIPLKP